MNEVACKRFRPALRSGTGIGGRHIRSVLRIGIASAMVAFGSMACWDPGVEPAVPTTVTVSPSVVDLDAFDQSRKLSATVLDQNGQQIEDASVTWSAARPRVATVDGSGLVKAAGNGETTVTATAGTASGSASVKVEQVPRRVTVSPETVAFDAFDQSRQLSATALDANGHEIEGASVAWSTANPGVATVDGGGLVKAAGERGDDGDRHGGDGVGFGERGGRAGAKAGDGVAGDGGLRRLRPVPAAVGCRAGRQRARDRGVRASPGRPRTPTSRRWTATGW